jgi:hypothetical protein
LNKTSVNAAVRALERLVQGTTPQTASADAEVVRALLSELSRMGFREEWAVHVDGEPMWCKDKDQALSLLRSCLARNPDSDSHLLRREYLLGEWVAVDHPITKVENHV